MVGGAVAKLMAAKTKQRKRILLFGSREKKIPLVFLLSNENRSTVVVWPNGHFPAVGVAVFRESISFLQEWDEKRSRDNPKVS